MVTVTVEECQAMAAKIDEMNRTGLSQILFLHKAGHKIGVKVMKLDVLEVMKFLEHHTVFDMIVSGAYRQFMVSEI